MSTLLRLATLAAAAAPAALTAADPFKLSGPGVDPAAFRITVFAGGLNYPKGMQFLPDGSLLVATSDPVPGSTGFYSSRGSLVRLADADGDGVADGPPAVLYAGLPGSLSGLRIAGSLVFACSTGSRISVLRLGASPGDPLRLEGRLIFTLPSPWLHPPSDLEVAAVPEEPGSIHLYFQFGSQANFGPSGETGLLESDLGFHGAPLVGDSIYRVKLEDLGGGVTALPPERIARGLRNAAGFALDRQSGDLYFQDNGIDGLSDPNEPLSADELNVLSAADLGGAVEDFGFPGTYVEYRSGEAIGAAGSPPLIAFQPLPDPSTGSESEGPAEIVFAPPRFPPGLNRGIFVGFHGKFNQGGTRNEENPLVYADLESREYFHFVGNDEPGIGHLDGLLAAEDSLFVADLTASGSLASGAGQGVIYRIQRRAAPEPAFTRGDGNEDGKLDVSDAVAVLTFLFRGGTAAACLDAADANDDGRIDIADALAVLLSLFADGRPLPPPGPLTCGPDPSAEDPQLGCEEPCR